MNQNIVLGVDVGGSHISSALINLQSKQEIEKSWSRSKLDSNGSAEEIIDAWADTILQSMKSHATLPLKISIAMPGPMDYTNGICYIKDQGKYGSLYNINLKEKLATRLGINPNDVNFVNDAACFLKGEVFSGVLVNVEKAIGLTLGTGLGTAHSKNGTAYDSNLWNMPFKKGIAEDYISTRWFIKRFKELSKIDIIDVKDLVENYKDSPYFKSIFLEFSINLSSFLYKFIRKKMPIAAVIGGNIANAEEYFLNDTRAFLAKKMGYSFPIERSVLGEMAILYGAGSSFLPKKITA